jgi:hypothetical protein
MEIKNPDKNINKSGEYFLFLSLATSNFLITSFNNPARGISGTTLNTLGVTRTVAALLWRSDALITWQINIHIKTKGREQGVY